jgi:hypothetical protein
MIRNLTVLLAVFVLVAGCMPIDTPVSAQGPKSKLSKPSISCGNSTKRSIDITFQSGASGAPAGFSVQWMTLTDFTTSGGWPTNSDCPLDLNGNPTCPTSFCKASFSGNANDSRYILGANAAATVNIGDNLFDDPGASSTCASTPLECGTAYVFRAFAHATSANQRSEFSDTLTCSTSPCEDGCTYTQGYWKTHGPIPVGNNSNEWKVTSLTLGKVTYTDLELLSIFNTPAKGNGLVSLAHQLIAAKLNVANGANSSCITATIDAADLLIGERVVPPVGEGSLPSSATSELNKALTLYNEGATTCSVHCGSEKLPEPGSE